LNFQKKPGQVSGKYDAQVGSWAVSWHLAGKFRLWYYLIMFYFLNFHVSAHFSGGIFMSQQHTKVEKRVRRKRYLERVRERIQEAKQKKKR